MRRLLAALGALVMIVSCDDASGPGTPSTGVAGLTGRQTALVGDQTPFPLMVRVTNGGDPVVNQTVAWSLLSGSGTITPVGPTDSAGIATADFVPSAAGEHRIGAVVTGTGDATFEVAAAVNQPPTEVAVILPASTHFFHDTFVRDGIAFGCQWNNGVILYDVGNGIRGGSPAQPVEISRILPATNGVAGGVQAHNAWWFHNPVTQEKRYLFVGQEGPGVLGSSSAGDIHVIDVSNLAAPVEVAFFTMAGAGVHNFWMDEARQILYAAYYNGGVVALDVHGTLQGNLASRLLQQARPGAADTYTWGVQLAGGFLWSIDMVSGLWKLDPTTLATRGGGRNVPGHFSSDFSVRGNYAYTGTFPGQGAAGDQIKVFRIDGANPVVTDSLRLPGVVLVSDIQASDDGRILVATAQSPGTSGLWVYSLADPAHPALTGRTTFPVNLHTGTLAEIDGTLYVFAARVGQNPGLQIWEVGTASATAALRGRP